MSGHGWGRSLQGRERRANADFDTRLDKWLNNVFQTDKEEKELHNLLEIQKLNKKLGEEEENEFGIRIKELEKIIAERRL
jgi:hypothetical protein